MRKAAKVEDYGMVRLGVEAEIGMRWLKREAMLQALAEIEICRMDEEAIVSQQIFRSAQSRMRGDLHR